MESLAVESHSHPRRRATANQRAVLHVLGEIDRFRSAQQLYVLLHQQYSLPVGLTSVYRILHTLAEDGVAETQRAETGEHLYRIRNGSDHRHYLLCRHCGRAVAFTVPALEENAHQLAKQHHYADVTHYVDVYGICPGCRSNFEGRQ
ncbi:Fur family transcriptional regulator [Mycolicibacterium sphagni]|uniref:Fe2+/Zn2+ uptake regulation protein n=1 Tax=Mycolicibacterium sphagni TaxID=1786 RepID=A0A255DGG4_9MYCO|nr:transcriptional repressor [Mycolicibacterium sphagni]MCV7174589.1 transcriptional repressor [Mycolicibacterium sphagni]OYN76052.1 Fe2+/Zn2+ uptake regulation protein [Mycolicibacterium sphagni]